LLGFLDVSAMLGCMVLYLGKTVVGGFAVEKQVAN